MKPAQVVRDRNEDAAQLEITNVCEESKGMGGSCQTKESLCGFGMFKSTHVRP
jgi:hypothetical protein